MTGFARREADTEAGTLAWEARSVNHRHFELSLRLPEEFQAIEAVVREAVATRVRRGKVDLVLRIRGRAGDSGPLVLDEDLLKQLIDAAHRVARELGQAAPPDPVEILRWPGVVKSAERDPAPLHERAIALLGETLDELVEARAREGERLAAALRERAATITGLVEEVRKRLPEVHDRLRTKLMTRIEDLGATPDPQRLEQELAIVAQRLDVAEELDRLDGHVTELTDALGRDEPVGRRLDFLLQEFNREANTLASKSQDAETTRVAVDLKVEIERIREQVQNIE